MVDQTPLEIFKMFWPEEGYAGIKPHLPHWTQNRASSFAATHGIRMTKEAKQRAYEKRGKMLSEARRSGAQMQESNVANKAAARALSMKW